MKVIALFAEIQQSIKSNPNYLHTPEAQTKLGQILDLVPQHLSAKLLLLIAQGKQPKTLSPTASMYYTFVAVRVMLPILKARCSPSAADVPSAAVKEGLADLKSYVRWPMKVFGR